MFAWSQEKVAIWQGDNILSRYSWSEQSICVSAGNGGYGRLGHVKQQDEFKPRNIETFNQRVPVAPDLVSQFCIDFQMWLAIAASKEQTQSVGDSMEV